MPIELKNVTYTYMQGTPLEKTALRNINCVFNDGEFIAIAGHTGSGKSTLVQHLNGLIEPTEGSVLVDGVDLRGKKKDVWQTKMRVGMVFQYPEHQLFEETVAADVAFGPRNLCLPEAEVEKRVQAAMEFVGLAYEKYKDRSPFQLSGGQMRRAAIAGIIAMQPKYLVLDEPTAGLDPAGKEEILQKIAQLHRKKKTTIILVSHNMEDIAAYADRVIFLHQGSIVLDDSPQRAFLAQDKLQEAQLMPPELYSLVKELKAGGMSLPEDCYTTDKLVKAILTSCQKGGR